MSRHRIVRSINYEDECEGYDDVYGHSVEEDYCVSPSTAAQFMFDRSKPQHALDSFMNKEHEPRIPEEDPEEDVDTSESSLHDSSSFNKPELDDIQQAQLYSCLEELRSILGDSSPEHVLMDAVIKCNFDQEKALNHVLSLQDVPKPQREPRRRRDRGSRAPPEPAPPVTMVPATNDAAVTSSSTEPFTPDASHGIARMTFSATRGVTKGFQQPSPGEGKSENCVDFQIGGDPGGVMDTPGRGSVDGDGTPCKKEIPEGATASTLNATPSLPSLHLSASATSLAKMAAKSKADQQRLMAEFERRKADKDHINLVVIGHVDAGKSTLMGHVLYQLGFVNKKSMHKYEQESKKMGKASFAYAWVLDETEEERSRGVTMDIAQTRFETESKMITLLDAPGHKDFIPNMITGAAQADVAIMVVNATRGEFETGFEMGGQTREHAMLVRSLGVSQLLVAINKMDTVGWAQTRYDEIVKKLRIFLKQTGFKENDVSYVPCSGLNGENLIKPSEVPELSQWYIGPCVAQQIDKFKPPERPVEKPLRLSVTDIFKGQGAGFSLAGTVQAGGIQTGDKVLVLPQGEMATVRGVYIDDLSSQMAFAGDNIVITLVGIDMMNVSIGSIVCDRAEPIIACTRFQARVVIFNIDIPITKGFPMEVHYQSLTQPGNIRRLISQLHKSSGEVIKKKPRCLVKNSNAVVEIEVERPICLELYKDYKDLGRIMLRSGGHTIAAGLVTQIMDARNK